MLPLLIRLKDPTLITTISFQLRQSFRLFSPAAAAAEAAASSSADTVRFLTRSCGLSSEAAVRVSEKIQLRSTKNARSILALLQEYGFTQSHIASLVAGLPRVLLFRPEKNLRPKLEFFRRIKMDDADIAELLSRRCWILLRGLESTLERNLKLLLRILGEDQAKVSNIVKGYSRMLVFDLPSVLPRRIEALKSYGVPESVITVLFTHTPKALIDPTRPFDETLEVIKGLNVDPRTTTFAHAFRALTVLPKPKWEAKLENFMSFGWSKEQALYAFTKHPSCMSALGSRIKRNAEFFKEKLGWGPEKLCQNPVLLSLSMDRRILPRILVLKILASKGLFKGQITKRFFIIGNQEFMEKYVIRYQIEIPELLDAIKGTKQEAQALKILS